MADAKETAKQPELAETLTLQHPSPTAAGDTIFTAAAHHLAPTSSSTSTYSVHMTSVINGAGIPVVMTARPNAASSTMLGGSVGMGNLGVITVILMLYNLFAGLGLGVVLWKGIIDWKGNVNVQVSIPANDNNNDNRDATANPVIVLTDNEGNEWYVPLTWVEAASQRYSNHATGATNGTVELTAADGDTGRLELNALVDAASRERRSRAAGLL